MLVILSISISLPEFAIAASHAPGPSAGFYRGVRPVCPIGVSGPGCFAPVRKSLRFVERAGFVAARAVGRTDFGAVRGTARAVGFAAREVRGVVRKTGRLLFGRRFR